MIAAILGCPLGTVQWRLRPAHDHLRLVLTRRHGSPLAATLREVISAMESPIRVTTEGTGPNWTPPSGDYSGRIQYARVTLDQERAAIPPSGCRRTVLAAYPDLEVRLGPRGPDATRGAGGCSVISAHTPGTQVIIECHAPEDSPGRTACFPGAKVGIPPALPAANGPLSHPAMEDARMRPPPRPGSAVPAAGIALQEDRGRPSPAHAVPHPHRLWAAAGRADPPSPRLRGDRAANLGPKPRRFESDRVRRGTASGPPARGPPPPRWAQFRDLT